MNSDNKRAFVTGSRAYGTPRKDSDIDLVVFVTEADLKRLQDFCELSGHEQAELDVEYISAGGTPLRFGELNLLCVTDERKYNVWRKGTVELKRRVKRKGKSQSREHAIEFFRQLRKQAGFSVGPPAGSRLSKFGSNEDVPF